MSDAAKFIITNRKKAYFAYGEKFCDKCRLVYSQFYTHSTCAQCSAPLRSSPRGSRAQRRSVPEELLAIERQLGQGFFFARRLPARAYLKYCRKCELAHPYSYPRSRCVLCNSLLADFSPRPPLRYVDAEVSIIE